MKYSRPDPTVPSWAALGEVTQPDNSDIQIGWPPGSQVPPTREEFNGIDKRQDDSLHAILQNGILPWDAREEYQGYGIVWGTNGSFYWNVVPCTAIDPVSDTQGFWELLPVRVRDADTRYLTQALAQTLYLTKDEADTYYISRPEMTNYATWSGGDQRWSLKSDLLNYPTFAQGDARWAAAGDLANYLSLAGAAATYLTIIDAQNTYLSRTLAQQTYLRIVDAANTYLTQSAAAQNYLAIADANNRFAQAAADSRAYTDAAIGNLRNQVPSLVPPGLQLAYRASTISNGSSLQGTWLAFFFTGPVTLSFAWGMGIAEEGDIIMPPPGFSISDPNYHQGTIRSAPGQSTPGDAFINLTCNFSGNQMVDCYYMKSNDKNTRRGRGWCFGQYTAMYWKGIALS